MVARADACMDLNSREDVPVSIFEFGLWSQTYQKAYVSTYISIRKTLMKAETYLFSPPHIHITIPKPSL